jgi:hypothetical protein
MGYGVWIQGKDENENDYAELYLNINSAENWIELREKDEEYRPAVLQFLTSGKIK